MLFIDVCRTRVLFSSRHSSNLFLLLSLYVSAFFRIPPSPHIVSPSSLLSTRTFTPTLISSIQHLLHLPLTQSPLHSESRHHLAFIWSTLVRLLSLFLPLTHILVNSQSLFLLHLLPTCLPIPENKLRALTNCVPIQHGNVLVKHHKSNYHTVDLLADWWECNTQ